MNFEEVNKQFFSQMMAWITTKLPEILEKLKDVKPIAANIVPIIDHEFARSNIFAIYEDLFGLGQKLTEQQIAYTLDNLVNTYKVPLKYTKDIFAEVNNVSIFKGYFEAKYPGQYKTSEINRLKKIILQGKYAGKSEADIAANIKASFTNISMPRCKLLARTETQRLREVVSKIYYSRPEVRAVYKRVWYTQNDDNVRIEHKHMKGAEADKNGLFHSQDVGKVIGPGAGPKSFSIGCRCFTKLVKR